MKNIPDRINGNPPENFIFRSTKLVKVNEVYDIQFWCEHDVLSSVIPVRLREQADQESIDQSLRTEISESVRFKICALWTIALWSFCKIGSEMRIPLTTVYIICQQPTCYRE